METIPEGLDQLTSLKYLNLSDNLLTDLTNLPSNLKNLSTLNLNNNKLVSLDGFNNLTSLEKVDLRRNKLKELSSLKPVVLQFIKNPDKFNNVYLANNLLPKSFRIDLFNLFNGIKYKNNMKIDDSRPGYFESALLLDSDAAFKAFEKFFGLMPETPKSHKTTASLAEVESITLSFKRLDVHEDSNSTIVTHTVVNSATTKTISPLSTNQNLTNLKQERNNTDLFLKQSTPPPPSPNAMTFSTPTPAFLHSSSSSTSTGPGIGGMKKSPTLNQLDLESIAAPGVITPIQVTARMSS